MHGTAGRYDEARALLRALCGTDGIHASLEPTANYRAVFARDAVMAGIAGLLLGDDVVAHALARTLDGLRAHQGAQGQIASNFLTRGDGSAHVSFGTIAPRLDGATWYLVGVALGARAGALAPGPHRAAVARVAGVLDALEYNGRHLVYVPTGGNWADEWIYEGYVLYDQALRAWGLRLVGALYDEPAWRAKARAIEARIAEAFVDASAADPDRAHPIAAFTPTRTFAMFDLAACALLGAGGVAPTLATPALRWLDARWLAAGALPPAFAPVIADGDADWPALRRYHLHGFRNRPHEYHNGGVWPIWLGWLALALARHEMPDALARLRGSVDARLAAHPAFAFEEYLHGVTGQPGGTARMAYTATGLLFLALAGSDAHHRLLAP